jgi:aryl-alcohol dehydrogenase-like predicted oxidoreductase
MEKRPLGKSGIHVAPLAFGGNVFGWTADEKTSFALLDAFVDAGFDLVDTADMYSTWAEGHVGGESETVIGKWFKQSGKRDKVVIATKVGLPMGDGGKGLGRAHIMKSVEDSLRRLQTDVIDLYQSHKDDPDVPQEETLEAYDTLVRQGKVRGIGASNYEAPRLAEALAISAANDWPAYVSLQPNYNLYDREEFEAGLEPLCLKEQIGVISYFSLARGFLTGKYRSEADYHKSPRGPQMARYLNPRGFRILAAMENVCARHQASMAAVALAWLIQRPVITAPIASATSLAQLEEVLAGARLKLTAEDVAELDRASG